MTIQRAGGSDKVVQDFEAQTPHHVVGCLERVNDFRTQPHLKGGDCKHEVFITYLAAMMIQFDFFFV